MGLYVEIMCDKQTEGTAPCGGNMCHTLAGANPGGYSVAQAKENAIADGWKLTRSKAFCPFCRPSPSIQGTDSK